MVHEPPEQTGTPEFPRRRFMRDVATAATVTCLSPSLLSGCQATTGSTASANADAMEQALEMMSGLAPLTNHGPMAAEALVALGRADRVVAWVEGYKKRFSDGYPATRQPITRENWREGLGDGNRVADWTNFFNRELKEAAWPQVLKQWLAILAPGLAAAAAHGVIRTGHAVRSLSVKETDLRRRELAEGLGYWAAYYQPLPASRTSPPGSLKPSQAVAQVETMPVEWRGGGSIMHALRRLDGFAPFANVADMVDCSGDASRFLSDLTETFAAQCLTQPRHLIAFIPAVTGPSAIRLLLPHLTPEARQSVLRYGWQAAAAIYAAFGSAAGAGAIADRKQDREDLIGRAVTNGDEHAIKFTEVCLREYALNPKPVYLLAARHAIDRLPPAASS